MCVRVCKRERDNERERERERERVCVFCKRERDNERERERERGIQRALAHSNSGLAAVKARVTACACE